MPYSHAHKQRTRERIVAAARSLFNRRGFVDVSIDDVMAEAGLTRGGFYNHFRNKEALLLAAVAAYGQCNPASRWDGVELAFDAPPDVLARQMAAAYLSDEHLEDIAAHCPLVALPADVAHAGGAVRDAYRSLLERMVSIFEGGTGDAESARALTALCVGAMLIGRTIGDTGDGREFLAASRALADRVLTEPLADRARPRDAAHG